MTNTEKDLETHSFILLGKTGAGKSSLCNNIAKDNKFKVGDSFCSCTSETSSQVIIYKKDNFTYKLFIIDTPGFEDSEGRDDANIEKMKSFIKENERIKCIVIVIDFNLTRCDKSLQNSIKIIAELFPLSNFWEHVIIVWSHYDKNKTKQKQKIENEFIKSLESLFTDLETNQKISKPNSLNMKFIDSDPNLEGEDKTNSQKSAEELVKDIIDMRPMYKEIKDGEEEDVKDEPKEGTKQGDDVIYNYKKRVMRTFIDFDDKKIEKEYIKEKYTVKKKKSQTEEKIVSLSSEETNNRNNLLNQEKNKYKDEEWYKRTKRENTTKKVKYVKFEYYKNSEANPYKKEETQDISEEWIEEKVIETEAKPYGDKITYDVYEYQEKRKNKYLNSEIIGNKKLIQTYYEEKKKVFEDEGSFNLNGEGKKIRKEYEQFISTRTGSSIGNKTLINTITTERYLQYGEWIKESNTRYFRKKELMERKYDNNSSQPPICIKSEYIYNNATQSYEYKDELDYREDGDEEGEFTEYYKVMRTSVYKLGDCEMEKSEPEKYMEYKIRARIDKCTTRNPINSTDVEETIKKKLIIYNEKTKKRTEKTLPTEKRIVYDYYTITHETKTEQKVEYIDSGKKDNDNEKIYYKNYIITIYRKDIIKDKNGEKKESDWYKYDTKKRKNVDFRMEYRRGEKTGRYSYTYFLAWDWNHKYEYKFYKTLIRYYDDGKVEREPEIYRGSWEI